MNYFRQLHLTATLICDRSETMRFDVPLKRPSLRTLANLFANNSAVAYAYLQRVQETCRCIDRSEVSTCIALIVNAFSNDEQVFEMLDIDSFISQLMMLDYAPPIASMFCYHYCKLAHERPGNRSSELIHRILQQQSAQELPDFLVFQDVDFETNMIESIVFLDENDISPILYQFILDCLTDEKAEPIAEMLIEELVNEKPDFPAFFEMHFQWAQVDFQTARNLVLIGIESFPIVQSFFEGLPEISQMMSADEAPLYLDLIIHILDELEAVLYFELLDCMEGFLNSIPRDNPLLECYGQRFWHDYGIDLFG